MKALFMMFVSACAVCLGGCEAPQCEPYNYSKTTDYGNGKSETSTYVRNCGVKHVSNG